MTVLTQILVVFAALCASACHEAADEPAMVDAANPIDAPETPACGGAGPAEMLCDGDCIDTSSDTGHCGACGRTCSGDTPSCAAGACVGALSTTWVRTYGGTDLQSHANAVAVDGAGNTYMTGTFGGTIDLGSGPLTSAGNDDLLVASFAPDGALRWSKRFGGALDDAGYGITVVGGNVYVTGAFASTVSFGASARTSVGSYDVFVLVMAAATGDVSAVHTYGTPSADFGMEVVVDTGGNITFGGFIGAGTLDLGGGHTLAGVGSASGYVASITATGVHRWSRTLGHADALSVMRGLAIDGSGNVIIGGELEGTTDFGGGMVSSASSYNQDAFIASYTSSGAYRWARVIGGVEADQVETVATDASGNVLVGGAFHGTVNFGPATLSSSGLVDGWVAGFDGSSGATRFARKLGGATRSGVYDVAADAGGNALVASVIEGSADLGTGALSPLGSVDIVIAGFDKLTGTAQFAKRYGGTSYEGPESIAVTAGGAMIVAGYFDETADLGLGPIAGGTKVTGFVMMLAR